MTTTTDRQPLRPSDPEPPAERREPLVRVVAGSVALGLLGAAVLTLIMFAGATEPVTTGLVLLAFAVGWTALAVLSSTLTSTPQRWALVPAAAMSVTGLGLLVFQPGDDVLNAAGYAWPPLLLALTTWMTVQLRRAMPGRARWLLYPVLAALAVTSVGGLTQTFAQRSTGIGAPMPGETFDVGGHRLHLNCTGRGGPTVVLENGLGESSPMWARVTAATSSSARVCAYDRAGQGWSDAATGPQDSIAVAADLHRLLEVAGEHGPYVLVGHSTGGVYAMTYAARYPQQVAGMVLLDSTSPRQFTEMKDYPSQYAMMRKLYGIAPTLARVGIGHLVPGLSASELPGPAGEQAGALAVSPRTWRTARDELSRYPRAFEQAQALTTLGDKPLVVVSASETLTNTAGWTRAQAELASLSTHSSARTVVSSHAGLLDDEHAARQSSDAVTDVVRSLRSASPRRTP